MEADPQLRTTVESNDPHRVRQAFEGRKEQLNQVYSFSGWTTRTFLQQAAEKGLNESVSTLIELGADPNTKNTDGWTALHYAASSGRELAAETLLRNGADPNAANNSRYTPLMAAAYQNLPNVVKLLLDHGADPNLISGVGRTALLEAIQRGHESCVLLLAPLSAGATTTDGLTALEFARSKQPARPEIVSMLRGLEVAGLAATREAIGSALGADVPELMQEVAEFLFSREVCDPEQVNTLLGID